MYDIDRKTLLHQQRGVIGVFSCREAAGQALDQLVFAGFPLSQLFLIGESSFFGSTSPSFGSTSPRASQVKELLHQVPVSDITGTPGGLVRALISGGGVGSFGGLLLGLGLTMVPGVGLLLGGSAIASTLVSLSVGAALGGLIGTLVNLGSVENQARECATQISRGNYLLIVAGTKADIFRAEHTLHTR